MPDALIDEMRALIPPSPCRLRPFVCDGLPQSCNVLVIGDNPSTKMDADWWEWWNDKTGFDLNAFIDDYQKKRTADGKRKITPTRKRLTILRECGLATLETNAYSNERSAGHGTGPSNLGLIQLFIDRLTRLRAIIAHGGEAYKLLPNLDVPTSIRVWTRPHFSGLPARKGTMSHTIVKDLADEVKESIKVGDG